MKRRPPLAELSTSIWRCISVHAFLSLMNDNCLMFHQFKELQESDAREGMVVEGFWDSVRSLFQDGNGFNRLKETAEDNLNRIRCFAYASCWSMGEGENALMWKAYAPGGIAIKTTVGKLMGAKFTAPDATMGQSTIEYADHWSELEAKGCRHDLIPLNWLFLHAKRKAFTSEAEVRFHVQPRPKFLQPAEGPISANPGACPPWCPVTFKTLDWIDRVVTAPSTPDWAAEGINQLAKSNGLNFMRSGI